MLKYLGSLAAIAFTLQAGTLQIGVANAQVRSVRDLPLALATEAVAAAVAECTSKGFSVSAAIVDRGGVLRTVQRADNAGPHTLDSSRRKAFTALTTKLPTLRLADILKDNPSSANLVYINDILVLGGGVPIKVGDEVIGAIGVGGTPSAKIDEDCALAGIAKITDRLK